jgi:hypothetical protein
MIKFDILFFVIESGIKTSRKIEANVSKSVSLTMNNQSIQNSMLLFMNLRNAFFVMDCFRIGSAGTVSIFECWQFGSLRIAQLHLWIIMKGINFREKRV